MLTESVIKCSAINGNLTKPCTALETYSARNSVKRQGMYLGTMSNMTTRAVRFAVWNRITGHDRNITVNYCPYCGTMISPTEYEYLLSQSANAALGD